MIVGMDKTFTDSQVMAALRKKVKGSSYRKAALSLRTDGAFIYQVLKGKKNLSDNLGIALGFKPISAPPRKWTR